MQPRFGGPGEWRRGRSCACLPLLCQGQMHVIPAVANACFPTAWIRARLSFAPEPGIFLLRSAGLGATVFVFEGERNGAEKACALFAEIAVGQLLQGGVVEAVVVDEGMEAIGAAVPQVPEEGAVVEELGVLLEA